MKIILTFENGSTENINLPSGYSLKMAKAEYFGVCKSNGSVVKVSSNSGRKKGTKKMFTYRVEEKHHELLKEIAIYLNEKIK